jgi:hypothetical protein
VSGWPNFPMTRTAFPWVPQTRWEEHPTYGVWRVTVVHPSPEGLELRAVHSGWREKPQEAWDDLTAHLEWWLKGR